MHTAQSQNTPKLHRMVIQVSREDTEGMMLALGNAINAKKLYDTRGEQFQVEIVAYGPGITMFRADKSPVKDRLAEVKKAIPGIVYSMCGNAKAAAESAKATRWFRSKASAWCRRASCASRARRAGLDLYPPLIVNTERTFRPP